MVNIFLFSFTGFLLVILLLGALPYYLSPKSQKPSSYWILGLLSSIFSFTLFGLAPLVSNYILVLANSFVICTYVFQLLFLISLNKEVPKRYKTISVFAVVSLALITAVLIFYKQYYFRVYILCLCLILLILLQLYQIKKIIEDNSSIQIWFLLLTLLLDLCFITTRLIITFSDADKNYTTIYDESNLSITIRWLWIASIIFSYLGISNFWAEKLAVENYKSTIENTRIKQLLENNENLLSSLLKANKTVTTSALSATLAHELNQPLAANKINLQLFNRLLALNTNKEFFLAETEIVNDVERNNNRATDIVKSIQSIFNSSTVSIEIVDINDLVTKTIDLVQRDLQHNNIELKITLNDSCITKVNENQFRQVIMNLLSNAIRAVENIDSSNKVISISTFANQSNIFVTVSNFGEAINDELSAYLFDLTKPNQTKGMGLGLWLCRNILERHNGYIKHHTTSLGETVFTVSLPLC